MAKRLLYRIILNTFSVWKYNWDFYIQGWSVKMIPAKKQFAVFHGTGTLVAPLKQNRIAKGKRRMSILHNPYTYNTYLALMHGDVSSWEYRANLNTSEIINKCNPKEKNLLLPSNCRTSKMCVKGRRATRKNNQNTTSIIMRG